MISKEEFKVLHERISPKNVQTMAELLVLKETNWLTNYLGEFALQVNHRLYGDIMRKNEEEYVLSDSYDLVEMVVVFLCEHFGKRLNDYYCTTKKGKVFTIKMHCYRLVSRAVDKLYRRLKRHVSLEALTNKNEPRTEIKEEQDYKKYDEILVQLNLTEYYETILNCRMAGTSFPEIGRIVERQISTVWVALNKIRKIYINTIQ